MRNPVKDGQTTGAGALANPAGNLLGIACVIGAVVAFTTQDMAIKWLSGDYPLHEIILARALVAITLTLSILVPLEGGYRNLRTKRLPLHLLRALAVVIANMTFFTGLATLPLGEATAIFFVAPLFITALSVPLLGERVGPRRWFAILVGLGGVTVMLRPGSGGFIPAFLLPLAAALAYALMQIMTRKLGMAEKASTMAFYIQLTFVVVSGAIGLTLGDGVLAGRGDPSLEFLLRAWVWPSTGDAIIMFGIGCLSGLGGYLISQAYRISEAALVAPFEYAALPLAVFWSVFLWGDWPDPISWLGIALITGAGLYAFYRETVRGRKIVLRRPIFRNR
jgi:drug/metabolite transporter (DMT)-like permease